MDEIEKAFAEFVAANVAKKTRHLDAFRAGFLAARKMAVEACMNTEVSEGRVGAIQYATKRAIAGALERLGEER